MAELRGKNTIASCFRETPASATIDWHESVCSTGRTTHDDNNVVVHPWIHKQREFPNKRISEFWEHIPADSNYWNIDLLAALAEVIPSCSGADVPAPYTDANPVYAGFASVRLWHTTRADRPSWRPVMAGVVFWQPSWRPSRQMSRDCRQCQEYCSLRHLKWWRL